jgi:import inner membrane translocase subunit TIM44
MATLVRKSALENYTAMLNRAAFAPSATLRFGRAAAYRRVPLSKVQHLSTVRSYSSTLFLSPLPKRHQTGQRHPSNRDQLHKLLLPRTFRTSSYRSQEASKKPEAAEKYAKDADQGQKSTKAGESTAKEDSSGSKNEDGTQSEGGSKSEKDGEQKQQAKEEPPPPPPHGDKSPWQVFTETLRSEFKASNEWNESTKAIASSAQQFTENESVRKARAAYSAASGAASSGTASALKTTGKVIGKSAAWTWETPVVKGVRAGVNLTGRAIEKGTRPVRDTEAYKKAVGGVQDVIDDGSSSRYGGWVEKEERRKKRELRELREAQRTGRSGKRLEKMEEDPE